MVNIFSEYLNDYWDKESALTEAALESEMLLAFVDQSNRIVYPNEITRENGFCNETLGQAIGCCDMDEDKACGQGKLCVDCPIRAVIAESFATGQPAYKKLVSKKLKHKSESKQRYFQITTSFIGQQREKLLVIFDDVTKEHQKFEMRLMEQCLSDDYERRSYDQMAAYLASNLQKMIASETVVISIMSPVIGFTRPAYISEASNKTIEGKECNEIIDREIWLECVTKGQCLIENAYGLKQMALGEVNECDITRLLLAPIMDGDQAVGMVIATNKVQPYTALDKELVTHITGTFIETIHHKQKSQKGCRV